MAVRQWFLLVVLGALSCVTLSVQLKQLVTTPQRSKTAYVTLLYGDSFLLGVRVLGQSIRDTGTKSDLVVIVTDDVSDEAQHTLIMDGWRVKSVKAVHNPGKWTQGHRGRQTFPKKFWGVYTKLQIFNLIEYKKAVYIDADAILVRNADVLFNCPGFCAALRHSERLNSGVMVVTPSTKVFEDITSKITELPSYTGGDQGFLNAYFADFANGFVFNVSKDYSSSKYQYMRLPTAFNSDVGLYVVNSNRWMIPRSEIYVFHYTLGPFKPWVWWNSWLVRESHTWEAIRRRLPADAGGYRKGATPRQRVASTWLVLLPPALIGFLVHKLGQEVVQELKAAVLVAIRQRGLPTSPTWRGVLPQYFVAQSIALGYASVLVALRVVLWIVPPEVTPFVGWLLSFEWGLLVTYSLFGLYLRYCLLQGQKAALTLPADHRATSTRPWLETGIATATTSVALVLAPWAGRILGINSFVGTILATVFSALVANILLNQAFSQLPVKWYIAGRTEGLLSK